MTGTFKFNFQLWNNCHSDMPVSDNNDSKLLFYLNRSINDL
jgi:hypothetical protein